MGKDIQGPKMEKAPSALAAAAHSVAQKSFSVVTFLLPDCSTRNTSTLSSSELYLIHHNLWSKVNRKMIFPRKSGHGVRPQDGYFHIPDGLHNRSMNVFFENILIFG
jgi:hypothetical protein